jgi:hypothetical protein
MTAAKDSGWPSSERRGRRAAATGGEGPGSTRKAAILRTGRRNVDGRRQHSAPARPPPPSHPVLQLPATWKTGQEGSPRSAPRSHRTTRSAPTGGPPPPAELSGRRRLQPQPRHKQQRTASRVRATTRRRHVRHIRCAFQARHHQRQRWRVRHTWPQVSWATKARATTAACTTHNTTACQRANHPTAAATATTAATAIAVPSGNDDNAAVVAMQALLRLAAHLSWPLRGTLS